MPDPSAAPPSVLLHRVAVAGNACALVILVLLCGAADVLFGTGRADGQLGAASAPATSASVPADGPSTTRRAVLVVVDGLRLDTASDPAVMPNLNALAARGGWATALVEGLVPSTVAGIAALASGRVLPPGSFLHDFRSPAAPDGGVFAAVRDRGGRSFVAGPRLWVDLYGRWIDGSRAPDTFLTGDETPLVDAAVDAVRGGAFQFVVLHVCGTDEAAHRFGGRSVQYAKAAAWADAAIGRVAAAAGPDVSLVVTSDHGVTDAGGHAGPEPDVLRTPLVAVGPGVPAGPFGPVRQAAVADLLREAVAPAGDASAAHPGHIDQSSPLPARAPRPAARLVTSAVAGLLAVWSAVRIIRALAGPVAAARHVLLCAAFWVALPLLLLGLDAWALAVALAALAGTALRSLPVRRGAGPEVADLLAALGAATAFGLVRTFDAALVGSTLGSGIGTAGPVACGLGLIGLGVAAWTSGRPAAGLRLPSASRALLLLAWAAVALAVGGVGLAALYGFAVGAGTVIAAALVRRSAPGGVSQTGTPDGPPPPGGWRLLVAGALVGMAHVPLGWLAGQTCSLSTIDVRAAYEVIGLPFGLPLAVAAVIVTQSVLPVGVLVGAAPRLRGLGPAPAAGFAAGLVVGPAGLAAAAALTLATASGEVTPSSLAVGAMLRALAETAYLFPGTAAAVVLTRRAVRPGERTNPRPVASPATT